MNNTDVILKTIVSKELKISHGGTKNNKNKNVKEVTLLFFFFKLFWRLTSIILIVSLVFNMILLKAHLFCREWKWQLNAINFIGKHFSDMKTYSEKSFWSMSS